jgi:cobaltochelatase CobS
MLVLDEMDASSAAVLTTLNTLLGNNFCSFPHGVFTKHPDFVVIASGNTWGRGATREYIGRAALDAATLNRFFMVPWDYDVAFESSLASSLAGVNITPAAKTRQDHLPKVVPEDQRAALAAEWTQYVWDVRASIEEHSVRAVVGSRDIVEGVDAIMMAVAGAPLL